MIDLGSTDMLSDAIDQWRKTFGMSPQGNQAGLAIRKQIWEPLLNSIGDARTVLVSTDGVLGRLPLGALPGKTPGTYLLEDHRIAMIPVPQLIPTLVDGLETKELSRQLLLLGDVDYDANVQSNKNAASTLSGEFSKLPGAAKEVDAIQALYSRLTDTATSDVRTLRGENASESAFRMLAGEYRMLHLATHGYFAPPELKSAFGSEALNRSARANRASPDSANSNMNPDLLSGLAFAGANREPVSGEGDGILTAQEIAFLPLESVDMAILSACETGLGEVAGGEGLIGIQRAFQVAGVRTTVASLWKVDDQATRKLMELFYTNLLEKKMSRLDALREAQLHILNHPESVYSSSIESDQKRDPRSPSPSLDVGGTKNTDGRGSPELWAAFQLSGDWR